jgi:hypothetical protein
MSSTGGVEDKVYVGIFTPAFSYPSSWSHTAIVKAALTDLGLKEDECEFLRQDNDKLACVIRNNNSMFGTVGTIFAYCDIYNINTRFTQSRTKFQQYK